MSPDAEKKIQDLKALIEKKQADKIRLEARLTSVLEQIGQITNQCKGMNLDPDNLSREIQVREQEFNDRLAKAAAYLAGEEVEESDDEPF